jgi:predicted nucleic acid-binding protein
MQLLWGYSDFLSLLSSRPKLCDGLVVDTNILISATYDGDTFFEQTNDLLDLVVENNVPLFYNVNVRAEFLEIQRRITFTDALLSFESQTRLATLPLELSKKLKSIRSNQTKREEDGRKNLRLSEADIKDFKSLMIQENLSSGNLWREFCHHYVGDQILSAWEETEIKFGLNPLSLRADDKDKNIVTAPSWEDAVELMSSEGLSSSDAMIVNMFQASNFEAILSSDADVGTAVERLKRENKICILPDRVLKSIVIA